MSQISEWFLSINDSLLQANQTVLPEKEGTIEQKPKIEVLGSSEHEVKTTTKIGDVNGKEAPVVEEKQEPKQQTKKGRHKNRKKKQRKDKDADNPALDDSKVAAARQDQKAVPHITTKEKSEPEIRCDDTLEKSASIIHKTTTDTEKIIPTSAMQSVSYQFNFTSVFAQAQTFVYFPQDSTNIKSCFMIEKYFENTTISVVILFVFNVLCLL